MGKSLSVKSSLEMLPENLRFRIMRRGLRINGDYPEGVVFRPVETVDEVKQSCALLYDAYTAAGFMTPDGTGHRFVVQNVLPNSYTLVGMRDGEVVTTVTLAVRSTDPLPAEDIFAVNKLASHGARIVEIAALAVRKDCRGEGGRILFPMFRHLYHFGMIALGATHFVMTCNPRHVGFYKAIMLFGDLSPEVVASYSLVDGAPACGVTIDLWQAPHRYRSAFGGRPKVRDMHEYLMVRDIPKLQMPTLPLGRYRGNMWSESDLRHLLDTLAIKGSALSEIDRIKLAESYGHETMGRIGHAPRVADVGNNAPWSHLNGLGLLRAGERTYPVRLIAARGDELVVDAPPELANGASGLLELVGGGRGPVIVGELEDFRGLARRFRTAVPLRAETLDTLAGFSIQESVRAAVPKAVAPGAGEAVVTPLPQRAVA